MGTVYTEPKHAGEFLKSEANGSRSRENIMVTGGAEVGACTVLGRITDSGLYKPLDLAASDGTENAAAVLYAAVDASFEDAMGAGIVRDAELIGDVLDWPEGIDDAAKTAQIKKLALQGLITR